MSIFRKLCVLVFTVSATALASCAAPGVDGARPHAAETYAPIVLDVQVIGLYPCGLHDNFVDGGGVCFDITVLEVIGSARSAGTTFNVVHQVFPEADSIWATEGKKLRIEVSDFVLSSGEVRISVDDVKVLPITD